MLRISWLFRIFRYSPANKVWQPKRGKFPNQDMAKVQNISEIQPALGFTEFDILEKYRKSFNESELGRLHSVFPFERMAKALGLLEQRLGRRNIFSPAAKIALMVLKERQHTLSDVLRNHDRPVLPHNQLQDSQCHPQ